METVTFRRADADDARSLAAILRTIADERVHSAIDVPWNVEQEHAYISSLSEREAIHVAVAASGDVVGFQSLDLWAPTLASTRHVAQLGTFLLPQWRGRGIGSALFNNSCKFARAAGYSKIVIQVRAMNASAQGFYRKLGFRECGRFTRQVRIHGIEDDEILMELFL